MYLASNVGIRIVRIVVGFSSFSVMQCIIISVANSLALFSVSFFALCFGLIPSN